MIARRSAHVVNIVARRQAGGLCVYCSVKQVTVPKLLLGHVYCYFLNYSHSISMFWLVEHSLTDLNVGQSLLLLFSWASLFDSSTVLKDDLNCRSHLGKSCCLAEFWLGYDCLLLTQSLSAGHRFWYSRSCFHRPKLLIGSCRSSITLSIGFDGILPL